MSFEGLPGRVGVTGQVPEKCVCGPAHGLRTMGLSSDTGRFPWETAGARRTTNPHGRALPASSRRSNAPYDCEVSRAAGTTANQTEAVERAVHAVLDEVQRLEVAVDRLTGNGQGAAGRPGQCRYGQAA